MATTSPKSTLRFYERARFAEGVFGWLFVLPVVVGTLALNVLPALPNVYYSLTAWNGLDAPQWIGLHNYVRLAHDYDFLNSLKVTVIFVIGSIPVSMIAGLLLALLVNQKLRGITFFRAVYYLPVISSLIAVIIVFQYLLAPRFGLINLALYGLLGVYGPNWLGDGTTAMISVIMVSVFTSAGYNMVLFLAGLQSIPSHLYEAAKIDGANRFERFLNITSPLLTPTTFFILILAVIGAFSAFSLIYAMTGGGPGQATEVIFYLLWQDAFEQLQFGYSSGMAVFMFVVIGILTAINWWGSKHWVFYG